QRLTAWGKNKVIPIKADEHSLIIELHLAQADTFHTIYNQEPTLAEVASNHMMNYIAKCFYPTYLELSHQLEARFKASQVTYRQYLSQENEPEDEISSFLDNTLNTLEEVREEYSVLMSQVD
ncbi:MAG TPA: hypothetical protein VLL52_06970, partial [Anaerolineae bacterium]|nr:hypothetical protein [Anaerolineae bacterium]